MMAMVIFVLFSMYFWCKSRKILDIDVDLLDVEQLCCGTKRNDTSRDSPTTCKTFCVNVKVHKVILLDMHNQRLFLIVCDQ